MIHTDPLIAGIFIGAMFCVIVAGVIIGLKTYIGDKIDDEMYEHRRSYHVKK